MKEYQQAARIAALQVLYLWPWKRWKLALVYHQTKNILFFNKRKCFVHNVRL